MLEIDNTEDPEERILQLGMILWLELFRDESAL